MAVFTEYELMDMTIGMTEQQRNSFFAQYAAAKRNRVLMLVFSIAFGGFGIDRFLVGDTGLGLLKLFTGGLFGILWLVDIFLITGRVDLYNRTKAQEIAMLIRRSAPGGLFDQF